tara:strand:+ start:4422 stop:5147 length:726 start_codon:yes stop_codon:yes gene_type:complete
MHENIVSQKYADYASRLLLTGRAENLGFAMSQNPRIFIQAKAGKNPLQQALRSLQFRAHSIDIVRSVIDSGSQTLVTKLIEILIFEGPVELLKIFFEVSGLSACSIDKATGLAPIHQACHSFYSYRLRPYAQSKVEVFKTALNYTVNPEVREVASGMSIGDLIKALNTSIPRREKELLQSHFLAATRMMGHRASIPIEACKTPLESGLRQQGRGASNEPQQQSLLTDSTVSTRKVLATASN